MSDSIAGVPKFSLGQIFVTPDSKRVVPASELAAALNRHEHGDWGNVGPKGIAINERALVSGARLFSVYQSSDGVTFWIITEPDRSATTVLLPENY